MSSTGLTPFESTRQNKIMIIFCAMLLTWQMVVENCKVRAWSGPKTEGGEDFSRFSGMGAGSLVGEALKIAGNPLTIVDST